MATIIKHDKKPAASGTDDRPVVYNFNDIEMRADSYMEQVRAEAAKIVHAARDEALVIRQQAEESGRQMAREAAEQMLDEKVGKRMETLTPALEAAVGQINDSKQQWLRHWEQAAVELAAAIAARIVRRELREQPDISMTWVREALELAAGNGKTTLRIHPDDAQRLDSQIETIQAAFAPLAEIEVVADPSISPAGCRVETQFGVVDQQLESQLERLVDELT